MKKKYIIISLVIFSLFGTAYAQQIRYLSLDEAISFAMHNNYQLINSGKDIEKARQQVIEQTSKGLPQINSSITYQDNFARPVFVLPGEFSGRPGQETKIQFGTEYTGTVGAVVSQLIFDGSYLVGLQGARKFLEKVDNDFFKNKIAVKQQVANSYYQVLSVEESLGIIDTTLLITKKLSSETRQMYKAGFVKDVDVDQLELLVDNMESSKTFMKNQMQIALAFLKFYLGLTENDSIVLTDGLKELIKQKESKLLLVDTFNVRQNINYISLEKQKEISALQIRLAKVAYMPSLRANLNLQTQAQLDRWGFFNSKTKWDFSSFFGVTMSIPIFSSGLRESRLKQAQIAFSQMQVIEKQTKTQLEIQYKTFRSDYANALTVYQNKMKNRRIAEKIYKKTTEKYVRGMASSLDLLNTHNQFLTAENDYITSSLKLLKAAEQLENILVKAQN